MQHHFAPSCSSAFSGAVVTSMSGYGNLDKLSATEPRDHRSFQVCIQKSDVFVKAPKEIVNSRCLATELADKSIT